MGGMWQAGCFLGFVVAAGCDGEKTDIERGLPRARCARVVIDR